MAGKVSDQQIGVYLEIVNGRLQARTPEQRAHEIDQNMRDVLWKIRRSYKTTWDTRHSAHGKGSENIRELLRTAERAGYFDLDGVNTPKAAEPVLHYGAMWVGMRVKPRHEHLLEYVAEDGLVVRSLSPHAFEGRGGFNLEGHIGSWKPEDFTYDFDASSAPTEAVLTLGEIELGTRVVPITETIAAILGTGGRVVNELYPNAWNGEGGFRVAGHNTTFRPRDFAIASDAEVTRRRLTFDTVARGMLVECVAAAPGIAVGQLYTVHEKQAGAFCRTGGIRLRERPFLYMPACFVLAHTSIAAVSGKTGVRGKARLQFGVVYSGMPVFAAEQVGPYEDGQRLTIHETNATCFGNTGGINFHPGGVWYEPHRFVEDLTGVIEPKLTFSDMKTGLHVTCIVDAPGLEAGKDYVVATLVPHAFAGQGGVRLVNLPSVIVKPNMFIRGPQPHENDGTIREASGIESAAFEWFQAMDHGTPEERATARANLATQVRLAHGIVSDNAKKPEEAELFFAEMQARAQLRTRTKDLRNALHNLAQLHPRVFHERGKVQPSKHDAALARAFHEAVALDWL